MKSDFKTAIALELNKELERLFEEVPPLSIGEIINGQRLCK